MVKPDGMPTRAPALGTQLAGVLRDDIVRRRLQPGTHLVEDALAAKYDVSRGPVRDALKELETQGLVESRRRGYHVVGLVESDVADLYELREAIESAAVRRAIDCADDAEIAAAREVVRRMESAADRGDSAAFATEDLRFHALLYRMSGNRRLMDVWQHYEPVLSALMQLTVEEDIDLHPSAHDHGVLLDLMVAGEPEPLDRELREHLRGAHNRMSRALRTMAESDAEDAAS